jgi:hypothetical protein
MIAMKKFTKGNVIFLLILLVYGIYAGVYIYKTSFVVNGERYFVLFDDAMISMRYARNLADGYGLVWNPAGDRVEGYTNPLWVGFMAIFHFLPIPSSKLSLLVQISGAIFLITNLIFVKKIAESLTNSTLVALLAVVLTAFYTPLNNWGLQGMEVSALLLITSISVWLAMKSTRTNTFSPLIYILLGVSTLIRIDMAVIYVVILVYMVIVLPDQRRKNLIWGLGLFAFFILGQTIFRMVYYGEPLPNTYYLKVSGYPIILRIIRGLYVLFQFAWRFNWMLFLFPLTALIFRRDREIILLFIVFIAQVAYSIYVGGDAWEHKGGSNRYISIAMPIYFISFVYAAYLIKGAIIDKMHSDSKYLETAANIGLLIFILASMVNFNMILNVRSLERWALMRQPIFIEGNKEYVQIANALKKITTPDATIAVVSAGAIPYFTDLEAIDLLGKNDPVIAHEPSQGAMGIRSISDFRPGHMKWNYDYSIGQLKPDVIVQLWRDKDEAEAYIVKYYVIGGAENDLAFTLRADSENILWNQVNLTP